MYLWQTRITQPKKAIRKDKKGNKKKRRRTKTVQEDAFCLKRANSISVFFVTHTQKHIHTHSREHFVERCNSGENEKAIYEGKRNGTTENEEALLFLLLFVCRRNNSITFPCPCPG